MSARDSIEIRSLSKKYVLGERDEGGQLREHLVKLFTGKGEGKRDVVWALRDVSFNVPQGQVVGIIGRNGAGKSTLLKLLSRITHPTSGDIRVRGRVASLLEVGTGFHEELTGRENIYLNGSILGMRRKEIDRHLEAIIEFSGVSQFVDTPIKRFSSGMRLRLGFAVAAHLEPDVLIVDEVLAVGDAGFQKKCIATMEDLRSGGRTVLFVSHNMAAVENLCSRALWIHGGTLRMDGSSKDVIKAYLSSYSASETAGQQLEVDGRTGTGELRFTRIEFANAEGNAAPIIQSGDGLTIRMYFRAAETISRPNFGLTIYTTLGTVLTDTTMNLHGVSRTSIGPGEGCVEVVLDNLNLLPGRYLLVFAAAGGPHGRIMDGDVRVSLDVEPSAAYGTTRALDSRYGIVYFSQQWRLSEAGQADNRSP